MKENMESLLSHLGINIFTNLYYYIIMYHMY